MSSAGGGSRSAGGVRCLSLTGSSTLTSAGRVSTAGSSTRVCCCAGSATELKADGDSVRARTSCRLALRA